VIDLASWLQPLDGENPSGEDLRNDARFHELERLAEPQVQVVHDERNRPTSQITTPGDWPAVLARAEELRAHGRDLRLLVLVTRGLASESGLAGLAEGLTLIARSLDEYWETLHPALRAGSTPRDAALRRVNALLDLQNSQEGLLASLRQATVFAPRGIGPVSGRDLEQAALDERVMLQEAASGLNGSEKAALAAQHEQLLTRVRSACAAMADQAGEQLAAVTAGARAALEALGAVDTALNSRIGSQGAAVPELRRFLERTLSTLERGSTPRAAARTEDATAVAAEAPLSNGHDKAATIPAGTTVMGLPERLSSRDDVVRCLDLVIAFYDRTEPSSPIPHLAKRMRRMVHMDFVELMEEMAPSGLKEFRLLAGVSETKKTAQKDER
jgi:type VI secretion system protein ImpA